ncbi:hypothetical protein Vadar_021190 [Vaccinium darrowii]|uniref:Uncharacterized protein n=1 Tax=Vaccinium darrowii TaxID=229202 RepID=A0ACB7Z6T4_9ERIC|nr:hypothetical protein Vadar_021190 [Vaccinium darrowii]
MFSLRKKLDFSSLITVELEGAAGGICVFWNNQQARVKTVNHNMHLLDIEISFGRAEVWRITGVHASSSLEERKNMWTHLSQLNPGDSQPWVLIGDFNTIVSNEEKQGGIDKEEWEMSDFRKFINDNELIDLGFVGYPFTWNNKRGHGANIRERLDRALVNVKWRMSYDSGVLKHLRHLGSDHCPLLVVPKTMEDQCFKRFIFDMRWVKHPECSQVVRDKWKSRVVGSKWFQVQGKIREVRHGIKRWRRTAKVNSKTNIEELKEQVEAVVEAPDFDAELYHDLERKLKQNYADEEQFWRDKARVDWLKEGDKNTAFFHAKVAQRRMQNKLLGLENAEGTWCEEKEVIRGIVVDYFSSIFQTSSPTEFAPVLDCVSPVITPAMNIALTRPVLMLEVRDAAFQMPPSKAPGPDGMPAEARKSICGIKLSRRGPSVSHLFFADDTLLFGRARVHDVEEIARILDMYGLASGQAGQNIRVADDPWLPRPMTFKPRWVAPAGRNLKVRDLIDEGTKTWRTELVKGILWEEEANEVLAMPLPLSPSDDRLIWHYTSNGLYSVKSGYEVALFMKRNGMLGKKGYGESSRREEHKGFWNELWSLPTTGKIKHFLWKACHNIIPVKEVLFKRKITRDPICPMCLNESETLIHLFTQCKFAQVVWKSSPLCLDFASITACGFLRFKIDGREALILID